MPVLNITLEHQYPQTLELEETMFHRLPRDFTANVRKDLDCPVQPAYKIEGDIVSGTFIKLDFLFIQIDNCLTMSGYRIKIP